MLPKTKPIIKDNNDAMKVSVLSEEGTDFLCLGEKKMKTQTAQNLKKTVGSAVLLALCMVLPLLTGQVPQIGNMLCPMHLPILLCGFICGPIWGAAIGFIAPVFRSLTLGMPSFFPSALCMAFELATYGAVAGFMHKLLPPKKPYIYCSLLGAMIAGRIIWGAAMFICVGAGGGSFTFSAFLAGAIVNAIPGIIVQIVLIPPIVMLLENLKAVKIQD